jgi:hypothetical protein
MLEAVFSIRTADVMLARELSAVENACFVTVRRFLRTIDRERGSVHFQNRTCSSTIQMVLNYVDYSRRVNNDVENFDAAWTLVPR